MFGTLSWIIRTNLLKCDGMVFKNYIKQVRSGQIEPKFAFIKDGKKSSKVKKVAEKTTSSKKYKNWLTKYLRNNYSLNPSNCTLDPSGKKLMRYQIYLMKFILIIG